MWVFFHVRFHQCDHHHSANAPPTHSAIKARHLVDIQVFSSVKNEEELLLLPGTALVVKSVLNAGNGLTVIQIEEDLELAPLLDFLHPETRVRLAAQPKPTVGPVASVNL